MTRKRRGSGLHPQSRHVEEPTKSLSLTSINKRGGGGERKCPSVSKTSEPKPKPASSLVVFPQLPQRHRRRDPTFFPRLMSSRGAHIGSSRRSPQGPPTRPVGSSVGEHAVSSHNNSTTVFSAPTCVPGFRFRGWEAQAPLSRRSKGAGGRARAGRAGAVEEALEPGTGAGGKAARESSPTVRRKERVPVPSQVSPALRRAGRSFAGPNSSTAPLPAPRLLANGARPSRHAARRRLAA